MKLLLLLFIAIGISFGQPSSSTCVNHIGDSGMTCDIIESLSVVQFPMGQSTYTGYIVILDSSGANPSDRTHWLGVLDFLDGAVSGLGTAGLSYSVYFMPLWCGCFPSYSTIQLGGAIFVIQNASTPTIYTIGYNIYNIY